MRQQERMAGVLVLVASGILAALLAWFAPVSRAASARLFAVEEPVTYASVEAVTIVAMAPHVVVIADSDPELFLIVMWPDAPHSLDSFLSTSDAMPEGDLRALLVDAGMPATVIDRVIAEARSQPR